MDSEFDTWGRDELIAEVRRLRSALTDILADAERLIGIVAGATKSAGEAALENMKLREALIAPGKN